MSGINDIGSTSLGVAALRALETSRPDHLFQDPYAAAFLAAVGGTGLPGDTAGFVELLGPIVSVRTRYFDEQLTSFAAGGCRQVVILASGMDSRPYRLDWPAGTRTYELDQPAVLDFKQQVLKENSATARSEHRPVAVDLREDWPAALTEAGFSPDRPTGWHLEGLIYALTAEQADGLLAKVTALSAAGSRLAVDQIEDSPTLKAARMAVFGADRDDLWLGGPPGHPADWLRRHGWRPDFAETADIAASYGRTLAAAYRPDDGGAHSWVGTGTYQP
ncbi:SAM-dependent methyltransferase [Fodinicola acaciae]|uniref:SAM-dependent methyltransferase n=1 Tax=Fodinicola acaciae TaxID=2681555 RepID=UPI0013D0FFB5|nr:SAM-dependent methyltransferase [Fodinicola acaciae]